MKLLVLDGNSILNRAYYGIKALTTKEGLFTNGIYGFLTMLQKLKTEVSPDAVAIAFDMRAPTFRHLKYAGYKSNRHGMPEELAQQMPTLKELLRALGYRLVECEGFEADDILGTLAHSCRENGDECVIATGDRDSLQLVGGGVTVRLASTKMGQPQAALYDEAKIMEDYGVLPRQLIEIKAIQGDSSDCIPGVAGLGPKGAGDLIQKFHDLDNLYANLDSPDIRDSVRQKLIKDKENAYLSHWLGEIRTDAPVETNPAAYRAEPPTPQAAIIMARLELFSLIEKLGLQKPAPIQAANTPAVLAMCAAPCANAAVLLERVRALKRIDFTVSYKDSELDKMYICVDAKIEIVSEKSDILALCAQSGVQKNTHDIKPLYAALEKAGGELAPPCADTLLAAYLLNPSASGYDVPRLMQEYALPVPPVELSIDGAALEDAPFCASAASLPSLADKLALEIEKNNQTSLLKNIELPLAQVLARMETMGFAVDAAGIEAYGKNLQAQLAEAQTQVWQAVGYEFNINSPKQLGEALFAKLGLPHGKKTKTGWSTNADVLEGLRWEHPAVELVLSYRTLTKLNSTYCEGLLKVIAPDGRIHSSFNQTETRTGRISSTEPNLQNIPVRTELGRELRRFFVARPGWTLVDADYSQIELRVLAHVANDKNMIQAFLDGDDIHRRTAAQVFHMPEELVTPLMRSRAKAVNFGIVYGIGAFSLSKDIGVSRKEAEQYIHDYLEHFSGVEAYMNTVVENAREAGYVETLFGRRRYLPELAASNFNTRSFGERVARNMPIQGAAADIIKIAMIRVEERLERESLRARLILQVHDELIVEAPLEEAERAALLLTEEMQNAVKLSVPMLAEAKTGETWYEAKA